MGNISVSGIDDLMDRLSSLGDNAEKAARHIVYEGAKVVADGISKAIQDLPEDKMRYLQNGDKFDVLTKENKEDLQKGLGVSKIETEGGETHAYIGFAGYGSVSSKKYPKGLPNAMIAQAIESGSSVRAKHPFVRPTVNKLKGEAQSRMQQALDEYIKNTQKG